MNETINNRLSLKWSSHPLKKNFWVTILVVIFLFAIWLGVYLTTGNPLLLALSVVIMLGSLSSFFLPTRYELDDDKVKIIYLISMRERRWDTFRSYYVDKNGVLLSPFERPSRLENFRGLYIRFNKNKEQVVDFVKSRIVKSHNG
jgi:uncharacterized membrane protein